jgi:RHS repeat-associated protein
MVVAETTGGQTGRYVYGNDLLAQLDPAGDPTFYHDDALGSTRALSNLAGQRAVAYSYDVFGAVRSQVGSSSQSFTYTGEQVDGELGLVFLRARYYDPQVGRFITRDPFPGFADESVSLNRYTYASDNPVNNVDPSGEIANFLVGAAVGGLAGFTAYAAPTLLSGDKWSWAKAGVAAGGGAVVGAAAPLIAAGIASGAVTGLGSLSVAQASAIAVGEVGLFKGAITEILNQQIEGRQSLDWGRIGLSAAVDAVRGTASGYSAGKYASMMVDYQYLFPGRWTYPHVTHLDRSAGHFIKGVLGGMGKQTLKRTLWPREGWARGSAHETWQASGGLRPPSAVK